jgi:hypothetical protein
MVLEEVQVRKRNSYSDASMGGRPKVWARTNVNRLYLMKLESFECTDEAVVPLKQLRLCIVASAMGLSQGWVGA